MGKLAERRGRKTEGLKLNAMAAGLQEKIFFSCNPVFFTLILEYMTGSTKHVTHLNSNLLHLRLIITMLLAMLFSCY